MIPLPIEIEEKITNLPVVNFGESEAFQTVIFSDDFDVIFQFYKENYLPDVLKTKPDVEQRVSLYLSLTNQDESFVEQTNDVLYRRPVPDIHTFLSDDFYMGRNNATLYQYWRDQLEEIFKEGSPVRKTIFGGSIGSGKSTVARKAFVYVLYRALCLRYPRATFNIDADATIACVIISMTLKQVYDTNLLPFVKLLESMPCFQKVMSVRSFDNFDLSNPRCPIPFTVEKSSGTIFFPDNIIITCGSNQGHFTGYNVINSFCDEINEKGVDEALALLNTLDNRFSSRFAGSDLVFQSIVSSARTTNSPIGEYIKRLPKEPALLVLNPCLWEVKPDPNFVGDGTTFPVLVGNGSIPSEIITNPGELLAIERGEYIEPTGCTLIHVPTVYKSKFELQLDQSIQDIAGMTTSDNNMVFRNTMLLQDNSLIPEMYFDANLNDNINIFDLLPKDKLFAEHPVKKQLYLKRAPNAPRYVHNDLADAGGRCDAGLSMIHKEYRINPITNEKETIYVTDFIIYVNAKTKIDLDAITKFYIDLVQKGNVNIHTISADQYQSSLSLQMWEKSGCFTKVEKVSVDRTLEPYTNMARLMESGKIKTGRCPKLIKELEALVIDKGKVTRTTELKDGPDSICGGIYNAQKNYYDIPQYEYIENEFTTTTKFRTYDDLIDTTKEVLKPL